MSESPSRLRMAGKYLSEVLVIIVGITLSFLFDEWRNEREDGRAEREYLTALRADLAQDTAMLGAYIGMEEKFVAATQRLATFSTPAEISDSLHLLIDAAASYVEFAPATSTFEELKQTGRTNLLRDDTLRRFLFQLHTVVYDNTGDWIAVDKQHVLSYIIPEMSNYFPITTDSAMLVPLHASIPALKGLRMRNLLTTGVSFKAGVLQMLKVSRAVAQAMHRRVDMLLAK